MLVIFGTPFCIILYDTIPRNTHIHLLSLAYIQFESKLFKRIYAIIFYFCHFNFLGPLFMSIISAGRKHCTRFRNKRETVKRTCLKNGWISNPFQIRFHGSGSKGKKIIKIIMTIIVRIAKQLYYTMWNELFHKLVCLCLFSLPSRLATAFFFLQIFFLEKIHGNC